MDEVTLTVGCRVEVNGDFGTVRFLGPVPPTKGVWAGIEWDNPARGKHNGSKDGVSYFACKNPTGGSFLRPNKLNKGITIYEAIRERYTTADDSIIFDEDTMYLSTSGGSKKVESVGMDKVQKQFEKLNELIQIGLRHNFISSAGRPGVLSHFVPNIKELEVSKNLLSSWDTICDIAMQLKSLKLLNVSENLLTVSDAALTRSSAFDSLHTLVLNRCQMTWSEVLTCSKMWPGVCNLHLVDNLITDMAPIPSDVFYSLEFLNLSENTIRSWDDVRNFDSLPKLATLLLNDCAFSEIDVCPTEFKHLKHISLARNRFETLQIFNEINKFPAVDTLTFRNCKVMDLEDYRTMEEIIVAKIGKLKTYNRSAIVVNERKSAELDYLRKYGLEWKNAGGHQDPELNNPSEEFLRDHPRFQDLINIYGAPADYQLLKKTTAIKGNLIDVVIEAPVKPEFQPVKRRLPLSMTIGNLKLLIQKLTKIEIRKQRLVYVSKDDDSYVVELHRDFETLHDVSIEPDDRIQVRQAFNYLNDYLKYRGKKLKN